MEPRPGTTYSTVYYRQDPDDRQQLADYIKDCIESIVKTLMSDEEATQWAKTPMKGYKRIGKPNRSPSDILEEMLDEVDGKRRNGTPKDFAKAPIDRWNKLFNNTDYTIEMIKR
jgi:hypothetical protein